MWCRGVQFLYKVWTTYNANDTRQATAFHYFSVPGRSSQDLTIIRMANRKKMVEMRRHAKARLRSSKFNISSSLKRCYCLYVNLFSSALIQRRSGNVAICEWFCEGNVSDWRVDAWLLEQGLNWENATDVFTFCTAWFAFCFFGQKLRPRNSRVLSIT